MLILRLKLWCPGSPLLVLLLLLLLLFLSLLLLLCLLLWPCLQYDLHLALVLPCLEMLLVLLAVAAAAAADLASAAAAAAADVLQRVLPAGEQGRGPLQLTTAAVDPSAQRQAAG